MKGQIRPFVVDDMQVFIDNMSEDEGMRYIISTLVEELCAAEKAFFRNVHIAGLREKYGDELVDLVIEVIGGREVEK